MQRRPILKFSHAQEDRIVSSADTDFGTPPATGTGNWPFGTVPRNDLLRIPVVDSPEVNIDWQLDTPLSCPTRMPRIEEQRRALWSEIVREVFSRLRDQEKLSCPHPEEA